MGNFFDQVSRQSTKRVRVRPPDTRKRPDTSRDMVNRVVVRQMLRDYASGEHQQSTRRRVTHRWDCGCTFCTVTRTAKDQGRLERRQRIEDKNPLATKKT